MRDSTGLDLIEGLKKALCSNVSLEERGVETYLVHTGFTYPDGDELHIVLRNRDGRWILTDDGHTAMWLSYNDMNLTDSRMALLQRTLSFNHAEFQDGRIIVDCADRDIGACLTSMIQALSSTADLIYTNRKSVRNMFSDDVRCMMKGFLGDRCEFDKRIKHGNEEYSVDIFVEAEKPLYVFIVPNSDHCKDAIIAILALKSEANLKFNSLTFIDSTADIGKSNLEMITNRSDKLFFGTPSEETEEYLIKNNFIPSPA